MAELVERTTGRVVEVPDDQVQAAFQSGQYGFRKGAAVPIQRADGQIGTVDPVDLQKELAGGSTLVGHGELRKAELDAKYGGVGGGLIATGEGAARGLTFGLSDPLAVGVAGALGGEADAEATRQHLADVKEAHPYLSTAGELAGAVAPIVLSGGTAAGAEAGNLARVGAEGANIAREASMGAKALRTVGAIPRASAELGNLAERGMAAVLGEGSTNAVARIAGKALTKAVPAAIEGALYSAGSQISESTLGNEQLSGEKLLAAMGHGALFGGLVGGGFGALGEAGKIGLERISPKLRTLAEEQGFRALGARKAFVTEAERVPGGARGIGRRLLDEGLIQPGENLEAFAPRLSAARDEAGAELGNILNRADEQGFAGPKVKNVLSRLQKEVGEEVGVLENTNRGAVKALKNVANDFMEHFGGMEGSASFKGMQEFRARLDDIIKWNTSPLAPVNPSTEVYKRVRGILEDELTKAGDEAAAKLGKSFSAEYGAAKLRYRQLNVADKAAKDSLERMGQLGANQSLSLTDKMVGAATMGGALAAGNPLAAIKGLGMSMASKVVRERGNATAAAFLDKVADLGAIQAVQKRIDTRIGQGVDHFLEGKKPPRLPAPKGSLDERFAEVRKRVQAADGPETHEMATRDHLQTVIKSAPKVAQAFSDATRQATVFLASKAPKAGRFDTLQPQLHEERISDADKAKFLRYARAVDDPLSIVDDMQAWKLTPESVEAVKAVYPKLYQQIQQTVLERVADQKNAIPYDRRVQLGVLLSIPTDGTLRPEFVQRMQSTFAGNQQNPNQAPAPPPGKAPDVASDVELDTLKE